MAMVTVNGVRIAYEMHGAEEVPLVMVHGSWESRRTWDPMIPRLAESFRVLVYDRRGHGESERPSGQGSVGEDVADLAALIESLGLAPAWVAGQSFGGSITLRLAGERPDLLRGITAHEPPLFALLADDPDAAPIIEGFAQLNAAVGEQIASGNPAGAVEQFFEEALGWTELAPEIRQMAIEAAPTYLDEMNDPDLIAFDLDWIRGFPHPVLLTQGDLSPPLFAPVIPRLAEALPSVEVSRFARAGHFIQAEQPEEYAEAVEGFIRENDRELARP